MTPLDDLSQTQMHLRRGAQDWLNQRQGHSRQGVEAALEFVADQTIDANVLDRIRRTKEPAHGRTLFAGAGRTPKRNRAQAIRIYFKFGFVRNPWDRVVSLYERTEAIQLRNEMTFEQFVDWIQYSSATCVHSSPHRYQLDWFVDANGNLLADFIGKFERLDEDWALVAQKLGLEEKLPHQRANPRARHYTEYHTPRTRDIVAAKFKVDIERFGYDFAG
jgi:hypothetical protein